MPSEMQAAINAHVAQRIRSRRLERGLTQQEVARLLGVSFQQLQKYEHGKNRISAGRLYQLATVLETGIESFFSGFETEAAASATPPAETSRSLEVSRLSRQFEAIASSDVKRSIYGLIRALDKSQPALDLPGSKI